MKRTFVLVILMLLAIPAVAATFGVGHGGPRTTDNDDTCDIAVMPSATLLLPYFEVDTDIPNGKTTIFSVTNVTNAASVIRSGPLVRSPGFDIPQSLARPASGNPRSWSRTYRRPPAPDRVRTAVAYRRGNVRIVTSPKIISPPATPRTP